MKDKYFNFFLGALLITGFFIFDLYYVSNGGESPITQVMNFCRGVVVDGPITTMKTIEEIVPKKKKNIDLYAQYKKAEKTFLSVEEKVIPLIEEQEATINELTVRNREFFEICQKYGEQASELRAEAKVIAQKLNVLSEQWLFRQIKAVITGEDENVHLGEKEIYTLLSSLTKDKEKVAFGLKRLFRFIEKKLKKEGASSLSNCTNTFGCIERKVRNLKFEINSSVKKLVQPTDEAFNRLIQQVRSLDYENRIILRNLDWLKLNFREGNIEVIDVFKPLLFKGDEIAPEQLNQIILQYFSDNQSAQFYYENIHDSQRQYSSFLYSYLLEIQRNASILEDEKTYIDCTAFFEAYDSLKIWMNKGMMQNKSYEEKIIEGINFIESEKDNFFQDVLDAAGISEESLQSILNPETEEEKQTRLKKERMKR